MLLFGSFVSFKNSPVAVANLANNPENRLIRHRFKFTQEVREKARPCPDNLKEVCRYFARQGEQDVWIFTEFRGQPTDRSLSWRGLFTPFDLAQVGRLDTNASSQFTHRKGRALFPSPAFAEELAEDCLRFHLCSTYYTLLVSSSETTR